VISDGSVSLWPIISIASVLIQSQTLVFIIVSKRMRNIPDVSGGQSGHFIISSQYIPTRSDTMRLLLTAMCAQNPFAVVQAHPFYDL
jgi:hypothetical protein